MPCTDDMTAPVPERFVLMAADSICTFDDCTNPHRAQATRALAPVLADLREQVEALRKPMPTVWATAYNEALDDVLALLREETR
jgi:hypothetical protein